jgi:hypothetical protein
MSHVQPGSGTSSTTCSVWEAGEGGSGREQRGGHGARRIRQPWRRMVRERWEWQGGWLGSFQPWSWSEVPHMTTKLEPRTCSQTLKLKQLPRLPLIAEWMNSPLIAETVQVASIHDGLQRRGFAAQLQLTLSYCWLKDWTQTCKKIYADSDLHDDVWYMNQAVQAF